MLPTLLRKGSHEKLQGAIVEDAFSANAGKSALAGVRAFLQSRCGNLKSAFHALDVHSVGQLTSDDFAKGLQRLGYSEDAMPVFHMVDATSSGLISFRSFLRVLGGISPEEEEATNHLLQSSFNSVGHTKSLQRSASEDAWRSARIPRHSSDGQQSRAPSPKHRASVSYIEEFTNPPKSLQVPERPPAPPSSPPPVATAELHARVAWLEEQCSTEQKQRAEMEDSLAQRLHTLVGVSISEQLDLLRQQLIDERAAREAAVAALCHNSEEMRCRNGAEECKSCVTIERVAEDAAKLNSQVEELGFHMNTRLAALEASCASTTMTATPTMPDVLPDTARLQHQIAGLLEQFQTMSQRLDSLESASTHQREQIFGVVEERLANQSSGVTKEVAANLQSRLACLEAAAAPDSALDVTRPSVERSSEHLGLVEKIPTVLQRLDVLEKTHDKEQIRVLSLLEKRSAAPEDADHSKDVGNLLPEVLSHVRGYLGERLESLRAEWKALIDEEHDKSCERAEVLGRTLGHEFERSITAQAIAEACAEARAAVGGMLESWREERGADGHDALSTSRLVKIEEEKRRGIQSALATVRGDLDGLRGRLQELSERAPPRVDEVTDRVTSLEAAFQHVTGTGRSEVEAIATAKTEQLCSGRLTAIDQGLARLSTEVTQQGDGLEKVQHRQQVFSEEILRRLRALVDKLDLKDLEPIGSSVFSARERSPGANAGRTSTTSLARHMDDTGSHGQLTGPVNSLASLACSASTPAAPAPSTGRQAKPSNSPVSSSQRSLRPMPNTSGAQQPAGCVASSPHPSPQLRTRPQAATSPQNPVASNPRMVPASVPQSRLQCVSPGGSSARSGAFRLSSAPGKP